MNLTTLIEEQKKEATDLANLPSNLYDVEQGEVPALHLKPTLDILTTAITKGYELALEEVEALIERNQWTTAPSKRALIKEITHLKKPISAISKKV